MNIETKFLFNVSLLRWHVQICQLKNNFMRLPQSVPRKSLENFLFALMNTRFIKNSSLKFLILNTAEKIIVWLTNYQLGR